MTSNFLHARTGGSGPEVLCLHSSGGSSGQWRALMTAGADSYSFIAPDFHGHGRSPQPPSDAGYSLAIETEAVARLLRGRRVHVVGHSFGACVAVDLARRFPSQVRSLTLYEPVLFGLLDPRSAGYRQVIGVGHSIVADARGGREEAAAELFIDYWAGAGSWSMMAMQQRQGVVARIGVVASHFDALFANPVPAEAIAALDLPALLLRGGRTPLSTFAVSERLGALLPSAVQRIFPAAGHLGPITHGADVSAAILAHLDGEQQAGLRAAA
jgi:pimeloyl-ACP methyl ester carboxylesterase